uniref:Uncharacterized protein n=1 Tax=Acrobeloides nanus TaxID=290746 RepID=A0A914EKK9_9BILA
MSFIKCLGELKEFNDDGVPIQEQEYCSTMKLPDGSTTKDLLDALFKKAKREPTDFKCNRTLVYDSDFDAYEDYSEDVLVDKGRYRFHLSRKYELSLDSCKFKLSKDTNIIGIGCKGMKDDEVREFFDVPRRQRDDDAASGISDVTRISHFTRDSLANNQWNYQPNQNPAQPPIWNQVYNQDTPPNLPHDYMQNNPPYSPHVYSQMNSPNPPHINNQTPPPTPPTQKLRRDDDTGSSDTLASGHHSIKSGVENLKVNDDKKNNEPKNKYYKGGVRKPAQTKTDTTKIVEYKTITRRSLGLDGVHGDVFDAHRDNFSDINIFNDNLEQIDSSAIEVTRVDDLRTPIIEANVFSDKIDLLHMENDLT